MKQQQCDNSMQRTVALWYKYPINTDYLKIQKERQSVDFPSQTKKNHANAENSIMNSCLLLYDAVSTSLFLFLGKGMFGRSASSPDPNPSGGFHAHFLKA